MRATLALLLLVALAAPAAAQAWPVDVTIAAPGRVRVVAVAPAGAVEVCLAARGRALCSVAAAGDTIDLVIPAREGDTLTVWAGDRPYVVGGTLTVLALIQLPAPGHTVYLPVVNIQPAGPSRLAGVPAGG